MACFMVVTSKINAAGAAIVAASIMENPYGPTRYAGSRDRLKARF